jgi:hypothetical protein
MVTSKIDLRTLLSNSDRTLEQKLALFAWLNLGLVESLTNKVLTATDAVGIFFNAENARFVREDLAEPEADAIMSHGVQLADLFDALSPEDADREFRGELATMRSLCLSILEGRRLAA